MFSITKTDSVSVSKPWNNIWHKVWWMSDTQQRKSIKYAYSIRGYDFTLTLNAENGQRKLDRQSDVVQHWKRERSFWLCQLQEIYHAPFIRKTGRTEVRRWLYKVDIAKATKWWHTVQFLDYKKHIDYCASVRDDALERWRITTTFYWYNVRNASNNGFYLY